MRRKLITLLAALALLSITVTTAIGGNIHFSAIKLGTGSVIAKGYVAGLEQDAVAVLTVTGTAKVTCIDDERPPNHVVPLPNPIPVSLIGQQSLEATSSPNDRIPINVETNDIDPVAVGC